MNFQYTLDRVYTELDSFIPSKEYQHIVNNGVTPHFSDEEEYYRVMELLLERVRNDAKAELGDDDDDYDEDDEYTYDDILRVCYFDEDSLLCAWLCLWYDCTTRELASHLRQGVWDMDTERFYYVTGVGYDTKSSDLLGGQADGVASKAFISFIAAGLAGKPMSREEALATGR